MKNLKIEMRYPGTPRVICFTRTIPSISNSGSSGIVHTAFFFKRILHTAVQECKQTKQQPRSCPVNHVVRHVTSFWGALYPGTRGTRVLSVSRFLRPLE